MIAVVLVFALPAALALGMLALIGLCVAGASVLDADRSLVRD